MAEEDEIDVLGDFSSESIFSKSETTFDTSAALGSLHYDLLNCDYSTHLDTSTTNSWFSSGNVCFSTELNSEHLTEVQPEKCNTMKDFSTTTENITDASGWTEKERNLLSRGIEIFGRSDIRLAQFIGSKTSSEVKSYLKKFYQKSLGKHSLESENISLGSVNKTIDGIMINELQIPASVEEVITSVSTAEPTIRTNLKQGPVYKKIISKSSNTKQQNHNKIQTQDCTKQFRKKIYKSKTNLLRKRITKHVEVKIPTEAKLLEETPTKIFLPSLHGEEVIKIQKINPEEQEDSDIDIDIESVSEDVNLIFETNKKATVSEEGNSSEKDIQTERNSHSKDDNETEDVSSSRSECSNAVPNKYSLENVDIKLQEVLLSLETPTQEIHIDTEAITELEKFVHAEFFEGRPVKTPERYLLIRNYILKTWHSTKPLYITKTSVRMGLKNCGDVNCIGRIHGLLEQIGAINFGCKQTMYVRPLFEWLFSNSLQTGKEKLKQNVSRLHLENTSRQRFKKKFLNDGEGGKTLTHGDDGEIIHTMVVEESAPVKKNYTKKPHIRLIYCKPFDDDFPQPFRVKLSISALLLMDLHAHTCYTEVMGLLGGVWDKSRKILDISFYEPCCNTASSAVHCDMCPISQAKAADQIHNNNLNVLGWFHSHPTFAPEPSQQDIDTQMSLQQWIGINKPCIGLILTPYGSSELFIESAFRCMVVDKKKNFEDQFVPYKFKTEIYSEGFNKDYFLKSASKVFNYKSTYDTDSRVSFANEYFLDRSVKHEEKFISAVKIRLSKCTDLEETIRDAILQGLINIIRNF